MLGDETLMILGPYVYGVSYPVRGAWNAKPAPQVPALKTPTIYDDSKLGIRRLGHFMIRPAQFLTCRMDAEH